MRIRNGSLGIVIGALVAGTLAYGQDAAPKKPAQYEIAAPGAYRENIEKTIRWITSKYDANFRMLRGCRVGGEGLQPDGFSIINENQFGGTALQPYEKEMSAHILERVRFYLKKMDYKWNGRREVLLGRDIPLPTLNSHGVVEIEGARQSQGGAYWIVTELPNRAMSNTEVERNLNHMVPALLQHWRNGDKKEARRMYDLCLKMWNGVGFLDAGAVRKKKFFSRGLCYFLYAHRATGFDTDPAIIKAIEAQLWKNQILEDGSIHTVYSMSGKPFGHTSLEICSLAVLIYDPRISAEWFKKTD